MASGSGKLKFVKLKRLYTRGPTEKKTCIIEKYILVEMLITLIEVLICWSCKINNQLDMGFQTSRKIDS